MARGRGARQGKVAPEVEKQVERISEKIKVPIVEYDVKKKDTTEFIRNTKPTTEYIREAKDTIEYIRKTEPTTEFIRRTEPTTEFIRETKPTVEFIRETKPTTEFIRQPQDTIEFIRKEKETIEFVPKIDSIDIAEVVKKALDEIIKRDRVVLKRAKFEDEIIKVFELELECPHCKGKYSLGGRKK